MNHIKTMFLMVLLTLIMIVLGGLIAGDTGVVIAFVMAMGINFFAYWFSDRMAIAMTRSRPLEESEAPHVYQAMRELTANSNMPKDNRVCQAISEFLTVKGLDTAQGRGHGFL